MIRAGYGRFFDKTHFEVIGGLYTGTPFTSSFTVDVPDRGAPTSGRATGSLPTDPFLVNGPVINRALLDQHVPGGQLLRNTGATWDNPDRHTPYTDEFIDRLRARSSARDLAVSADYVHSQNRDLLMALNLNPQVRSNPNVNASTLTRVPSPTLVAAYAELHAEVPGVRAVHDQRHAVRSTWASSTTTR